MEKFSNKVIFVLALFIGLTGCGSTPKVETYVEPLSKIKLSGEKTYSEVLSSISTQMNTPVLEYSGEFGQVKYLEYNAKYFNFSDIYENFAKELGKSCSGYLSGRVNSLETIMASKKVDLSQYIAQEKVDLIHSVNMKDSSGRTMGFNFDGSRVNWNAIFWSLPQKSTDEFPRIMGLGHYIYFALKEHPYDKMVTSRESYVCLGDNEVSEILIIGKIKGQSKNIVLLIPKDAAFKMIQKQLELALEAVVYKSNASERSRKMAEVKNMKITEDFENAMTPLKELWANRTLNDYTLGMGVCTYNNKFGYVEQVSGNRIKVLWAGQVTDKIYGWFFGTRSINSYKNSSFEYSNLDRVTWENKERISSCDFDL